MTPEKVRKLFRCIDWMMDLPKDLERHFWNDVDAFEKENKMPFIDIATQVGMEKGEALGMEIGIRAALVESILIDWEFKFGDEGKKYQTELDAIQDVEVLRKILRTGKTVSSLGELRKLWHADAE